MGQNAEGVATTGLSAGRPLPGALRTRLERVAPAIMPPRALACGRLALLDELCQAGGHEAGPGRPVEGQYLTRLGQWSAGSKVPVSLRLHDAELVAWLDARESGASVPWLAVYLGDEAFSEEAGAVASGGQWERLLHAVSAGDAGLALDSPGDGACPLFANRRCQGAAAGNLVASPGDCATLCLDLHVGEFVGATGGLDMQALVRAVAEAVELGNALLDSLAWPPSAARRRTTRLRRLGLHLAGLGRAALRLGLDPRQGSCLTRLAQVVDQAVLSASRASLALGRRDGPFPALLQQSWSRQPAGADQRLGALLHRFCLRNSHLVMLSPASLMSPAQDKADLVAWAGLLPLLARVDLYCGRLPPAWVTLAPDAAQGLLRQLWWLGRRRDGVRAW